MAVARGKRDELLKWARIMVERSITRAIVKDWVNILQRRRDAGDAPIKPPEGTALAAALQGVSADAGL